MLTASMTAVCSTNHTSVPFWLDIFLFAKSYCMVVLHRAFGTLPCETFYNTRAFGIFSW